MDKFVINGGRPISGKVSISGAKNAAVAILPAAIMADGVCEIENVPHIRDTEIISSIIADLGAEIACVEPHVVRVDPAGISKHAVAQEQSRHLRASYYFLGALLARFGRAEVSLPGGCNLGARPVDKHLKAFSLLGCEVDIKYGMIHVNAPNGLKGAYIFFDNVSVGATINTIMAAVKAEGQTVLENAAKEPHIVDIANFLNSMGADIRGAGTDVIKIRGVPSLHATRYSIIPDQIEAGTYLAAAAATGGDVTVEGVIPKHLESIISRLRLIGADISENDEWVRLCRTGALRPANLRTMPHPGFPTDMQPQTAVVLSLAQGTSIITEGIWDNRFKYVDELRRMGARIQVEDRVAVIEGIENFTGACVRATDLRAGAALVIAGLAAQGVTVIEDVVHIDRGYEDIVKKLSGLGADIQRVSGPDYGGTTL